MAAEFVTDIKHPRCSDQK